MWCLPQGIAVRQRAFDPEGVFTETEFLEKMIEVQADHQMSGNSEET